MIVKLIIEYMLLFLIHRKVPGLGETMRSLRVGRLHCTGPTWYTVFNSKLIL